MPKHVVFALFLAVIPEVAGLAQSANVPPAVAPTSPFAALVDRFSADRSTLMRRYPADYSPERYARLIRFYKEFQQELAKVPYEPLNVEGRIDYTLLSSRMEYELRLLSREQAWVSETSALLPFAKAITDLVEARGRLDAMNPEKAAATLDQINREIEAAMKRSDAVRSGASAGAVVADAERARKINAFRAAEIVTSYKSNLQEWSRFYSGYDPLFSWWTSNPYAKVDKALTAYVKMLREKIVGYKEGDDEPIIGSPIGRAGLVEDLKSEFIPYTPEELLKIAEREFAWCDREMLKASREMGFGDDWKAALEKVKTLHVEPGKQTDLVRDLAREAEYYVEKRNLITIPPLAKEDWRMIMMSPERQKVSPFFLGGEQIIVSYPTDTMDHDDKMMSMRGNNIHFSRSTVFHELNPGHHLQQFMTARYNTHRRAFGTPFWTEGWSLYWEMLLWDDGFPKTPENKIGMLFCLVDTQNRQLIDTSKPAIN